jgi:hypothetical protein
MKDTDLYRQILGIETPWKVASVDLDPEALRIEVLLSHKQGLRWACRSVVSCAGSMITRTRGAGGTSIAASFRHSSGRGCLVCGVQITAYDR